MIRYSEGNIFDAPVDAIVNTVNLVGVMGKGVAMQFKERFRHNFDVYKKACDDKSIDIGRSLVTQEEWNGKTIWIINFPTKIHWRNPSQLVYIEKGLDNLREIIISYRINSIAIPPLGAGNGGLNWKDVKRLIECKLSDLNCDIVIFAPGYKAVSEDKRIKLTPARAILTYMLAKMQDEGMDVTSFGAVKMAYFLQKFGAEPILKLKFERYLYGPYNDQVRHILHSIDGAYVRGFADMSKKPFEPFDVIRERLDEVKYMVECDLELLEIVNKTCAFLKNNWDDFSLELLSSVDFLMNESPDDSEVEVYNKLCSWNDRKAHLFHDYSYIHYAYEHIVEFS